MALDPTAYVDPWTLLGGVIHFVAAMFVTVHVLLTKESSRAAIGWVGLAWLSPALGPVTYVVLGINRVQRKGLRLLAGRPARRVPHDDIALPDPPLPDVARFLDGVTDNPLVGGNRVTLLDGGEHAYPAMIDAIDAARHSVLLQTFILDPDRWGQAITDALARAQARGVAVRVLIDGVGTLFSWPSPIGMLRRAGIVHARFLWTLDPRRMAFLNLRNHRKVLVVDGRVGFTGGMNVRGSFVRDDATPHAHRDVHVRLDGPAVADLLAEAAGDWTWTTGEALDGPAWFPALPPAGDDVVRVIPDGPDEDLGDAELAFIAGLACARYRAVIQTPYFLPEDRLQGALAAAARRGVAVDVILPARTNQPMVGWAAGALLPHVIADGVRVTFAPGPFDHAKLMVVDGAWCLLGSANWDPRSLRLNFELQLEVWSHRLGAALEARALARRDAGSPATVPALSSRPLWVRLRDGFARLFTPYL